MDNQNYQSDFQQQHQNELEIPLTLGEWLITIIILWLPCIGIIMSFVWAFGNGNKNRRNFCRAHLIIMAIGIVLSIISYVSFAALIASTLSNMS